MKKKNAVIAAMFGTSVESALADLLGVRDRLVRAFSETPVRIAFSSRVLRQIWHARGRDSEYRSAHPEIPAEMYTVASPVDVAAELARDGCAHIVVQPIYMTPGREYQELLAAVELFRRDNPAVRIAVGKPALGLFAGGPASDDIRRAAHVLGRDVEYSRGKDAALVYMGHGTAHASSPDLDRIYRAFEAEMERLYPEVMTRVATVEGTLGLDRVIDQLGARKQSRVVLKPLMVVAGNHVRQDMLGPPPRGWKARLEQAGFTVDPVLRGLGGQEEFADIFVRHAAGSGPTEGT